MSIHCNGILMVLVMLWHTTTTCCFYNVLYTLQETGGTSLAFRIFNCKHWIFIDVCKPLLFDVCEPLFFCWCVWCCFSGVLDVVLLVCLVLFLS